MTYVLPVFESLILPPGLFILFVVLSLVLLHYGRRRAGLVLGGVTAALLYLTSISGIADWLILPLENRYPPYRSANGAAAEYVVVLGGGIVSGSPAEAGHASLLPEALKRLVYGVRIAREVGLPLIVSGGIVPSDPVAESEAEVAQRTVDQLFGPGQQVRLEGKSRNTWENAVGVERSFHPKRVILVTSAYHMPRSVLAFRRNHIEVIPAPTDYIAERGKHTIYSFLPSTSALKETSAALKEYVGYLYYRLLLSTTKRSS